LNFLKVNVYTLCTFKVQPTLNIMDAIVSAFFSLYQDVCYIKSELESNSEGNIMENIHYIEYSLYGEYCADFYFLNMQIQLTLKKVSNTQCSDYVDVVIFSHRILLWIRLKFTLNRLNLLIEWTKCCYNGVHYIEYSRISI